MNAKRSTPHSLACTMTFGRLTLATGVCARCDELRAGAVARPRFASRSDRYSGAAPVAKVASGACPCCEGRTVGCTLAAPKCSAGCGAAILRHVAKSVHTTKPEWIIRHVAPAATVSAASPFCPTI